MKKATELVLNCYTAKINCPFCEAEITGFLSDPRGVEIECDECNEKILVPDDISLNLQ